MQLAVEARRGRLEILGDGGRHDDPELRAEPEHEEEAPVKARLPSVLLEVPHHRRGILTERTTDA